MTKNKKSQSHIPYPKKLNIDDVSVLDDADLFALQRGLIDSISKVNELSLNSLPWETELCYVQRELQIRGARKDAHARFLGLISSEVS